MVDVICGRDTWAEIDLDAVADNTAQMVRLLPHHGELMAIVKADAYGHGAIPVAQATLAAGATQLGVAIADEALELRRAGIKAPITILGYVPAHVLPHVIKAQVVVSLVSLPSLSEMEAAAAQAGQTVDVNIKVDTGLRRLGLDAPQVPEAVRFCKQSRWLRVAALSTHCATPDEEDTGYLQQQMELFQRVMSELPESPSVVHVANTAATFRKCTVPFRQLVRVGLGLYGIFPAPFLRKQGAALRPVLTLRSRLTSLRRLTKGCSVGYGRSYVAQGDELVATVPIGYADGIRRDMARLGGCVLVRGRRAPMRGVISMDQLVVDVTAIPEVAIGDEVVLYGDQGQERLAVEAVAEQLGTIPYELLCAIGRRVPRRYLRGGQVESVVNQLSLS